MGMMAKMGQRLKAGALQVGKLATMPLDAVKRAFTPAQRWGNYDLTLEKPNPKRPADLPLPTGFNVRAGNVPTFGQFPVYSEFAYRKIRTTFATAHAVDSHGAEIAALDVVVKGWTADGAETGELSERAKALQTLVDHSIEMATMMARHSWCYVEGVLFWQKRWRFEEGVGLVGDFREGERKRARAGGRLSIHPDNDKLVLEETYSPWALESDREARLVSMNDWIAFRPFGSPLPDGDSDLAIRFYRVACDYEDVQVNASIFAKHFTLPYLLMKYASDELAPAKQAARLKKDAQDVADADPLSIFGMGEKNLLDYAEPKGTASPFLNERETRLESQAMRDLNGTALLSDTRASGPSGSSKEARVTQNKRAIAGARFIADVLSTQWLADLEAVNDLWLPGLLPPYKPGEMRCYIELQLPGMRPGDTNKAQTPAADEKPEDERPDPEGRTQKDTVEVKEAA